PKNFSKNSSMESSSGLDRPRGAGSAAICVVDTLTTIGWSFFASVTKSGDPLDGAAPLLAKNPPESFVFLPEQPSPIPVIKNSANITVLRIIFLQGLLRKLNLLLYEYFIAGAPRLEMIVWRPMSVAATGTQFKDASNKVNSLIPEWTRPPDEATITPPVEWSAP